MVITSKTNSLIKEYIDLRNNRKTRYNVEKFVVEGSKVCMEALRSSYEVETVYITESAKTKYNELQKEIEVRSVKIVEITEELSKYLSDTATPQGIYVVCKMLDKMQYLDTIEYTGKYVILENIQDPGNLGTIIRTADAFGIKNVFVSADSTDIYSPKVIRSTTGSIFRQNCYIINNLPEFINILNSKGGFTYGTVLSKAAQNLGEVNFSEFSGIVIGNEGNGVTTEVLESCNGLLTIPMNEKTESLNAGLAAGIIMWEMCK